MEPRDATWMDRMDRQLCRRSVLSTSEAWALAMTWEQDLREHIALTVSVNDSSVIKSYAWLEVKFPQRFSTARRFRESDVIRRHVRDALIQRRVDVTRATTLVWRALSSCPGFRTRENPVFWKYVLSELGRPRKPPPRSSCSPTEDEVNPVVDAARFFKGDDGPFTRVCLSRADPDTCRAFCDLDPLQNVNVVSQLDEILTRLAPLVDEELVQRPIQLKLSGIKSVWEETETFLPELLKHLASEEGRHDLRRPGIVLQELAYCWGSIGIHELWSIPITAEEASFVTQPKRPLS